MPPRKPRTKKQPEPEPEPSSQHVGMKTYLHGEGICVGCSVALDDHFWVGGKPLCRDEYRRRNGANAKAS